MNMEKRAALPSYRSNRQNRAVRVPRLKLIGYGTTGVEIVGNLVGVALEQALGMVPACVRRIVVDTDGIAGNSNADDVVTFTVLRYDALVEILRELTHHGLISAERERVLSALIDDAADDLQRIPGGHGSKRPRPTVPSVLLSDATDQLRAALRRANTPDLVTAAQRDFEVDEALDVEIHVTGADGGTGPATLAWGATVAMKENPRAARVAIVVHTAYDAGGSSRDAARRNAGRLLTEVTILQALTPDSAVRIPLPDDELTADAPVFRRVCYFEPTESGEQATRQVFEQIALLITDLIIRPELNRLFFSVLLQNDIPELPDVPLSPPEEEAEARHSAGLPRGIEVTRALSTIGERILVIDRDALRAYAAGKTAGEALKNLFAPGRAFSAEDPLDRFGLSDQGTQILTQLENGDGSSSIIRLIEGAVGSTDPDAALFGVRNNAWPRWEQAVSSLVNRLVAQRNTAWRDLTRELEPDFPGLRDAQNFGLFAERLHEIDVDLAERFEALQGARHRTGSEADEMILNVRSRLLVVLRRLIDPLRRRTDEISSDLERWREYALEIATSLDQEAEGVLAQAAGDASNKMMIGSPALAHALARHGRSASFDPFAKALDLLAKSVVEFNAKPFTAALERRIDRGIQRHWLRRYANEIRVPETALDVLTLQPGFDSFLRSLSRSLTPARTAWSLRDRDVSQHSRLIVGPSTTKESIHRAQIALGEGWQMIDTGNDHEAVLFSATINLPPLALESAATLIREFVTGGEQLLGFFDSEMILGRPAGAVSDPDLESIAIQ